MSHQVPSEVMRGIVLSDGMRRITTYIAILIQSLSLAFLI